MTTRQVSERTTRADCCEIDGRVWFRQGNVARCSYPRTHNPPQGAQVTTPHPTRPGFKIAWVFLGGLVAAFIASPWIAKLMGCAALVLPFWVCR